MPSDEILMQDRNASWLPISHPYNGQFYHQVRGGAMGSPLTLTISNCYMYFFERQIVNQIRNSGGLYFRYIDDIFITINWPVRHLLKEVDRWNKFDENINLSANIGSIVNFLDLSIENQDGQLYTTVFQKPSYEPYYLPFNSIHPLHMKKNIPFAMLLRAVRYCSTFETYLNEREKLRMALLLNKYPNKIIDEQFNNVLSKFGINEHLTLTNYNRSRQRIIDSPNNVSIDCHGSTIRQYIQEQRWIRRFSLKIWPFTQQPNSVPERTNEDMDSKQKKQRWIRRFSLKPGRFNGRREKSPRLTVFARNLLASTAKSCWVCRDQRPDKEIESRLTKSATAFNMLRNAIWYRKAISREAKLRIFRAFVLPVLLYGSEVWSLTAIQENRISTFYMKCLRTILGRNLGDRVANITIMQLSGEPSIENLMRRNRLRWFGHANRMENENGPHLVKKIMFSYFPGEKRPTNTGIRKRWENKIMDDIEKFDIKNWRKDTKDKDRWREIINRHVTMNPVPSNIKSIIQEFKDLSKKRRAEELAISHGKPQRKATGVLHFNVSILQYQVMPQYVERELTPVTLYSPITPAQVLRIKKNVIKNIVRSSRKSPQRRYSSIRAQQIEAGGFIIL
ncbi:unnamed protein product [Rotaria socialis]